jgi:hypothetical protein
LDIALVAENFIQLGFIWLHMRVKVWMSLPNLLLLKITKVHRDLHTVDFCPWHLMKLWEN